MVAGLPTGRVTFFFSDIEGSTRLVQRLGAGYPDVLAHHNEIVRSAISDLEAFEIRTMGDSFFLVFVGPGQAVDAAVRIQQAMEEHGWPEEAPVRIRIGLHTGEARLGGDDYAGIDVNRAARIMDAGHGGQVLVSAATRDAAAAGVHEFADLGTYMLKDLDRPEHLFQVVVPGLPAVFAPLRTRDAAPNNLPAMSTRLVGRDEEILEIGRRMEESRLITLLGPGGVGKTRLAIAAAGSLLGRFPDGVAFADLSHSDDPATLPATIAAAVQADEPTLAAVVARLATRRSLLVLDNFEQIVAAADVVGSMLEAAPALKCLVTSQVPLGLSSEQRFPVEPLGVGEGAAAATLFVARAKAAHPGFTGEPESVARIVNALDGIPLALELAAARANVLSLDEMLGRLDDDGFLVSRGSDRPDRQRSLEATLRWSYDLLDADDRAALCRLALLPAGMSVATAEAIIGSEAGSQPLDRISELVDRSLLARRTDGSGRLTMLDGIRRFALRRLDESGDRLSAEDKFADWFGTLAADAYSGLQSDRGEWWRARLDTEHDNLRAVLAILADRGEKDRGLELLGNVWRFLHSRGHLRELERWLEQFFEIVDDGSVSRGMVKGLMARGALRYWQSQPDQAVVDYRSAVEVARRLGDEALLADAVFGLATSLIMCGVEDEALALLAESKALYGRLGDNGGVADVSTAELFYRIRKEGIAGLGAEFTAIVRLYQEAGRKIQATQSTYGLAWVALAEDRPEDARRVALEGLNEASSLGDRYLLAWGLDCVAMAEIELGDIERGAILTGIARAAASAHGGGWTATVAGLEGPASHLDRLLGPEAAEAAIAPGLEMTLEDGLALARSLPPR